jgi:hypothetical protein
MDTTTHGNEAAHDPRRPDGRVGTPARTEEAEGRQGPAGPNEPAGGPGPDLAVTVCLPGADGSEVTTCWHADGRVRVERAAGTVVERFEASLDGSAGTVVVHDCDAAGVPFGIRQAESVLRRFNAYGTAVELQDYGCGLTVLRRFDDDDRLRETVVRTPVGVHRVAHWPDGSRAHTWQLPTVEGRRHWNASGVLVDEESSLRHIPADVTSATDRLAI